MFYTLVQHNYNNCKHERTCLHTSSHARCNSLVCLPSEDSLLADVSFCHNRKCTGELRGQFVAARHEEERYSTLKLTLIVISNIDSSCCKKGGGGLRDVSILNTEQH